MNYLKCNLIVDHDDTPIVLLRTYIIFRRIRLSIEEIVTFFLYIYVSITAL